MISEVAGQVALEANRGGRQGRQLGCNQVISQTLPYTHSYFILANQVKFAVKSHPFRFRTSP
ncbi:hypothetical protein SAMN05216387_101277 [Nitrosovibrio tenuis]|uniref:Uncharacterized protein n=1 Tax=Nitrosovibrio tenuis TaxID=1233 RepID=A0A1H7GHA3_9PROT|nr:hypothetical protein SAMN05216387_101277 [Nitrosovibrio tenuis]